MIESVRASFTAAELEHIDLVMASAQNRGAGLGTLSELVRHATLTYVDFVERMSAGQLDGSPSARLLSETVPGLDPFGEREVA